MPDVLDQHRALRLGRASHNPLPHLDPQAADRVVGVADAEAHPEFLRFLVEQEEGEDLVVDGAFHHLGDTHHQLVQIEGRADALAHFEQQGQKLGQFERPSAGFGSFGHV